jgi:hypothetical protein
MTPEFRSARGGTLVLAGAYVARGLGRQGATIVDVLSGRAVAALDRAGELHAG